MRASELLGRRCPRPKAQARRREGSRQARRACTVVSMAVIVGLGLPATGCKKTGSSPNARAMEPDDGLVEPDDPLAELAALEDRMRMLGLPVAPAGSSAVGGGPGAGPEPGTEAVADAEAEASVDRAMKIGGDGEAPEQQDQQRDEAAPMAASEASEAPSARTSDSSDGQGCSNVCELSEAICQLEVRICGLSDVHQGDPIYVNACSRAIEDCDVADDACDRCAR